MDGARHLIILPALCWNQRRRDFYAVTMDVSVEGIRFRSASPPNAGEILSCSIRHVGLLEARIDRAAGQEFVASVRGGGSTLAGLARLFVTLSRAQGTREEPLRVHHRIVPRQTVVEVTLDCGSALAGQVLNVSASGVALLVEPAPEIGTPIRVGRRRAHVVRHFSRGVGAAFVEPFEPGAVHDAMIL